MSTLAEIESAVPSLGSEELERLEALLRKLRTQRATEGRPPTDLAEFAGALQLDQEPLAWQRQIREEWK